MRNSILLTKVKIETAFFNENESLNLAFDDCFSDSTVINKRVKPRNVVCVLKSERVYLSENFRDLGKSLQEKTFKQFMCSISNPRYRVPFILVCSSRIPENTEINKNFDAQAATIPEAGIFYLLKDSFSSSYSYSNHI